MSCHLSFSFRRNRLLQLSAISGVLLSSVFSASKVSAQWTDERSYLFNYNNVKHYTVAPLPGSDFYLMAGSLFELGGVPGDGAVQWMYVDNTGTTVQTKVINDPAYDEHAVGAGFITQNDAYIVATHTSISSPGISDGIEVLRIDGSGTLQSSSRILNSTDPAYTNLFPIGMLQYSSTELFICGYATPYQPYTWSSLTTDKQAFVLKYDLSSNTVTGIHFIDGGSPVPGGVDLDIAARMKMVSSGIWVGGSVFGGEMMNRIIDPGTLNDVYSVSLGTPSMPGKYESSYDVSENQYGDLFVFGNNCYIDDYNTAPYKYPRPLSMHITAVDPSLNPYPGRNRAQYNSVDLVWGVNTVEDNGSRLILSGMQANRVCNSGLPTTPDNINPFLTQMRLQVIGGSDISVNTYFWKTILSNEGTGNSALSISYLRLGNPWSNLALAPVTTVNDKGSTNDIMLTCPVWNSIAGLLSMKWIRTDNNGELANCKWENACATNYVYFNVPPNGVQTNTATTAQDYTNTFTDDPYRADYEFDCSKYFRTAGVTTITGKPVTASLSPNPATDYIQVQLSSDATEDKQLDIKLIDVTGKQIGVLYSGHSNALPARLNLPQLAPGLYFVNIQYGNDKLKTMSVSIK